MGIEPMLLDEINLQETKQDRYKGWVWQEKHNGVRAIVHVKDGKITAIRNRNNVPILYLYPELKEATLPFKVAVLDGEIVVMQDNKSVFYGGIDSRRSVPTDKVKLEKPVTFICFDAIHIDGETLNLQPYSKRLEHIQKIPQSNLVQHAISQGPELWDKITQDNREGVVIKNPNSIYEPGKRSSNYLKVKNYKLAEVRVEKTEINSKGTKIYATLGEIQVEAQLAGVFGISQGDIVKIKYLDIVGTRLIQPTKS
jgi:ATP-dependent DNA ligase